MLRLTVRLPRHVAKAQQGSLFDAQRPQAGRGDYQRVSAPKGAEFHAYDCARCGYQELEHPVFLHGAEGLIVVGSDCAEKLTGRAAREWQADLAADALAHADAPLQRAYTHFSMSLPERVTKKMIAEAARFSTPEAAQRAAGIYKALRAVNAARTWRKRALT